MQIKQLLQYLSDGLRNLSEPPTHLLVGENAFCSAYSSEITSRDSPFWTCILGKSKNEDGGVIYLVQYANGKSTWVHAEFFWTKEQVLRLLVCGPKGKKGKRKYNRLIKKIDNFKITTINHGRYMNKTFPQVNG